MANDISSGNWRIDTLPFSYPYPVKIVNANWTDQTAAGDQLIATQGNGKPLIDSKAQQANFQQNFGNLGWYTSGIKVTKLDSGVLNINVGSGR